jgi:hypothetical protein
MWDAGPSDTNICPGLILFLKATFLKNLPNFEYAGKALFIYLDLNIEIIKKEI